MKRTLAIILLLCLVFLTSCSPERRAEDIAAEFCRGYPLEAKVYSSLADEHEEGYIDAQMLVALYGSDNLSIEEFALILYGKVGTVWEIGIFVTKTSDERMELYELASGRIKLLSSLAEGEAFVRKYRGVFVYGFVDDAERAKRIFDGTLGSAVEEG